METNTNYPQIDIVRGLVKILQLGGIVDSCYEFNTIILTSSIFILITSIILHSRFNFQYLSKCPSGGLLFWRPCALNELALDLWGSEARKRHREFPTSVSRPHTTYGKTSRTEMRYNAAPHLSMLFQCFARGSKLCEALCMDGGHYSTPREWLAKR